MLGVHHQGYHEWRSGVTSARAQENELLLKHIEKTHPESRGTYGWPRVHAELTLWLGLTLNHKRVARLLRGAGIQGLYRRRRRGCTAGSANTRASLVLRKREAIQASPSQG
ncbi:hypothetical protein BJF78_14675 [Pseudonocardia sp. CNS-139]|nr:hypothetical protein BJF78_14675 [Pseudonocardia sp. CNS-139]